jgi:tRNA threonylcarbamoyladenosine biosynthesis protein TsaE
VKTEVFRTASAEETRELAARLAAEAPDGTVMLLSGDLGAGKTCFAQGLARACGVAKSVTSPTFTLVNEYAGRVRRFAHMDLYRMAGGEAEAHDIGIDDYLEGFPGLVAIEWPAQAASLMPEGAWRIELSVPDDGDDSARFVTVARS